MYFETVFSFYVLLYHFVGHSFLGLVFFGSFSNIIKRNFSLTLTKLNFYVDMSVWLFVGKQYYRLTGTVSVKMYLTFLARVDIIKMWKPGRLPQHMCFWICEVYYSQINEPSVAADGSLFTISEPVDDLANQPEDRKYPEQVLKCYMYHLLRDISRRGYTCLPPFRSCGMTGNRL